MKNQNNDSKKFDEILSETNKCRTPEEVKKKLEEYEGLAKLKLGNRGFLWITFPKRGTFIL